MYRGYAGDSSFYISRIVEIFVDSSKFVELLSFRYLSKYLIFLIYRNTCWFAARENADSLQRCRRQYRVAAHTLLHSVVSSVGLRGLYFLGLLGEAYAACSPAQFIRIFA